MLQFHLLQEHLDRGELRKVLKRYSGPAYCASWDDLDRTLAEGQAVAARLSCSVLLT
jgi:hypothetical protein